MCEGAGPQYDQDGRHDRLDQLLEALFLHHQMIAAPPEQRILGQSPHRVKKHIKDAADRRHS